MEWYALNCINTDVISASFIGAIQLIAITGVYLFDLIKYFKAPLR